MRGGTPVSDAIPDQTLDLRGSSSPIPVVRTAKAMKALEAGAVLELISGDAAVDEDLRAWSLRSGHEVLSGAEELGTWRVLLRKGRVVESGR
jgi:tRNA 2-thiouridine synthesizing protein A